MQFIYMETKRGRKITEVTFREVFKLARLKAAARAIAGSGLSRGLPFKDGFCQNMNFCHRLAQ